MSEIDRANRPRWRGQAGFYEIWFTVVFDLDRKAAYWFRYTTFAPAKGDARATVWAASFGDGDPSYAKAILPASAYASSDTAFDVRIGDCRITTERLSGEVDRLKWDLSLDASQRPLSALPAWTEALRLPVHSIHTAPRALFSGWVEVSGERREVKSAPGVQAHIWGRKRVRELRWLYIPDFEPDTSLEVVWARPPLKIPVPPISKLELHGARNEAWRAATTVTPTALEARASRGKRTIVARAWCEPADHAGYVYRDPRGEDLHVAQCDIASAWIEELERGRPIRQTVKPRGAALELHQPEPLERVRYIAWDDLSPSPFTERGPGGEVCGLKGSTWNNVFALGLTYRAHVKETGEKEGDPVVFNKHPRSISLNDASIPVPTSEQIIAALEAIEPGIGDDLRRRFGFIPALMDYEVELGVAVHDRITKADLDDDRKALPIGFFVANDLTARSAQILGEGRKNRLDYWAVAKSFEGFLPVGPVLMPVDGRSWPEVTLETRVNGELRQTSSVRDMFVSLPAALSAAMKAKGRDLDRGDLVLTGTPGGIALSVPAWKRKIGDLLFDRFEKLAVTIKDYARGSRFLRPGDIVTVSGGPLGERSVRLSATFDP